MALDTTRRTPMGGLVLDASDEIEHPSPDFDTLFAEPKPKRHKWGADKFNGSFVRHTNMAVCTQCGLERHKQFDYGQHRTIFRDPKTDKWFLHDRWPERSALTPPCAMPS